MKVKRKCLLIAALFTRNASICVGCALDLRIRSVEEKDMRSTSELRIESTVVNIPEAPDGFCVSGGLRDARLDGGGGGRLSSLCRTGISKDRIRLGANELLELLVEISTIVLRRPPDDGGTAGMAGSFWFDGRTEAVPMRACLRD